MNNTALDNTSISFYGGEACSACEFIGEFIGYRIYFCDSDKNIYATSKKCTNIAFECCAKNRCIFDCLSDLLIIYNNTNVYGEVIDTQ